MQAVDFNRLKEGEVDLGVSSSEAELDSCLSSKTSIAADD